MVYRVVLTGDTLLNTSVSACEDVGVLEAIALLRSADVTITQLEIPLHDFRQLDVMPSAEGALSWMSGPSSTVDELRWCGIDMVSLASNHALDYSYGGLASTLAVLDRAGIPHAGAGLDLGAARSPAFLDTTHARIALVSAVSSFPAFARAGAARVDVRGRPGVNPLRRVHVLSRADALLASQMFGRLGYWVTHWNDELAVNPPGLHNTLERFMVRDDVAGVSSCCDERDLAGNIGALRYGRSEADFVVAHLHCHEWDANDGRMCSVPAFAEQYAHAAVDAGASAIIIQGSHAPMRGIEIYRDVPVLYDPGPLFRLGRRDKQPQDFYERWGNDPAVAGADATITDAFRARAGALVTDESAGRRIASPTEGNAHWPGFVIPVCEVDAKSHRVVRVKLHPANWATGSRSASGFPQLLRGERAKDVIRHLAELSAPYGTVVNCIGEVGEICIDL